MKGNATQKTGGTYGERTDVAPLLYLLAANKPTRTESTSTTGTTKPADFPITWQWAMSDLSRVLSLQVPRPRAERQQAWERLVKFNNDTFTHPSS